MMNDSVLYFPSIRVPETLWFTRVLLYWDTVGTIVPHQYLEDPQFLRPYTAGLIDEKLVKAVTPDDNVWKSGAHNYYKAFLDFIDGLLDSHLLDGEIPLQQRETVRIHTDKTGTGLASALAQRKLARPVDTEHEWDSWFEIEKRTGNLFMAYLAAIIARSEPLSMVPITDSQECLGAFANLDASEGQITARLDPIRTEILTAILPAPADLVHPAELARFKNDHSDLLKDFRTKVEQHVVAIAAVDDPRLKEEMTALTKRDLNAQLEEITRRMSENRWRRISLGDFGAVAASGIALAEVTISGGMLTLGGVLLGLISALYTAFKGTQTPEELLRHPLAYAAQAHRSLAPHRQDKLTG